MKKLNPRKKSSSSKYKKPTVADNIKYVRQLLQSKSDAKKPAERQRGNPTSSTDALEEKISRLQEAMRKQAEMSGKQIAQVKEEADSSRRTLDDTRKYLSRKEATDEKRRLSQEEATTKSTDTSELDRAAKEKEEDDKVLSDKEDGEEDTTAQTSYPSNFDDFMSNVTSKVGTSIVSTPAAATPATPEATPAVKAIKAFNIGDIIPSGDNNIRITNLFGPRVGANTVPGRHGMHSKGIDFVGTGEDGSKNVPVVVADGTIVNIGLDGDGTAIKPENGAALGYYADVKVETSNGPKIFRYGHLGKALADNKATLLNTQVKKGSALYPKPAEGYLHTGSATNPHVKLQVSSLDGDKMLKDYEENDPSQYLY